MDLSWKYSSAYVPPAPILLLTLAGFPLQVVLDTGFGGSLLVPLEVFESLGLMSALTEDEYTLVLPDSRKFSLYTAEEEVGLGGRNFRAEVHASPCVNRRLAGRSFIRRFVATLKGPEQELTIHGDP